MSTRLLAKLHRYFYEVRHEYTNALSAQIRPRPLLRNKSNLCNVPSQQPLAIFKNRLLRYFDWLTSRPAFVTKFSTPKILIYARKSVIGRISSTFSIPSIPIAFIFTGTIKMTVLTGSLSHNHLAQAKIIPQRPATIQNKSNKTSEIIMLIPVNKGYCDRRNTYHRYTHK